MGLLLYEKGQAILAWPESLFCKLEERSLFSVATGIFS